MLELRNFRLNAIILQEVIELQKKMHFLHFLMVNVDEKLLLIESLLKMFRLIIEYILYVRKKKISF